VPNLPHLASIATLTMIGTMSMELTPAIAQNPPRGCWEVEVDQNVKVINRIYDCGPRKICAVLAAGRVDGGRPQLPKDKEVFKGPATMDAANSWRGRIYVYYYVPLKGWEQFDVAMTLTVESSQRLTVQGSDVRDSRGRRVPIGTKTKQWNKVGCP
jgi:hypothetical protein